MANIIENAKQIVQLELALKDQLERVQDRFDDFEVIPTSLGSLAFNIELLGSNVIDFAISTEKYGRLRCGYNLRSDELVFNSSSLNMINFKELQSLLDDVEVFIRNVLQTVN